MEKNRKVLIIIAYLIPPVSFLLLALSGTIERRDPSGLSTLGGFIYSFMIAPVVICVLGVIWKMVVPVISAKLRLSKKNSTSIIVLGYFVISILFSVLGSLSIAA